MTRRDQCYLVGRRARTCSLAQAAAAWIDLSDRIEAMGDLDIPKFRDVLYAIRKATITGKMINHDPESSHQSALMRAEESGYLKGLRDAALLAPLL